MIVNTGDGKGKTTASLGILMRSWGRDMRIGMLQFIKRKGAKYGEIRAAEKIGIELIPLGDGWTSKSKDMDETIALAIHAWENAQKRITSGEYDVLVLDEFTYPLAYKWLNENEVIRWLRENKPPMLHLVITGRYASQALIDFADLVTEMKMVKHPYQNQGIKAQPGIDY